VTDGTLFHAAWLGRPAAIQSRAVTPLGIQLNSVGRIANHQPRLALAQQPGHRLLTGGIRAQQTVLMGRIAAKPQVAKS
jgi:hypothetical protein